MSKTHIYIDADACPVREETYKIALRHDVPVTVVSNSFLRVMRHPLIKTQIVTDSFDAADDWIVESAVPGTISITSDILLAERILKKGAEAIAPNGKMWTDDNIGAAIATRAIMADLRAGAEQPTVGGPPPFSARDRSQFLQNLHEAVLRLKRG